MQAARHCRRSGAPKSQGRAANKKRVEIDPQQACTAVRRPENEAVAQVPICMDDGHVPDLPNGSGRNYP